MDIEKIGTLYFDNTPVDVDALYFGQRIIIGDTKSSLPSLTWVRTNGLLVGTHTICKTISWESLNKAGLVYGRLVRIDQKPYLCRSLKVGSTIGDIHEPSEWDKILEATTEDDDIWHWGDAYFWGQERFTGITEGRMCCGYYTPTNRTYLSSGSSLENLGFRPVLEELNPLDPSDIPVGSNIKVHGPSGTIHGTLTSFNDYDLSLRPILADVHTADNPWYYQQEGGTVIINRGSSIIAKET